MAVVPVSSHAVDVLRMKSGKLVRGKIEMITHKVVSFRVSVDLGRGKRGEVKRSIALKSIDVISFGPLENELRLLKLRSKADPALMRKLWDQKVPYLGQPESNAGEVGLLLAELLLKTDSTYHWSDAMALYGLIERKSWKEEDRQAAQIARIRGLMVQGKLEAAMKAADRLIGKNEDEGLLIEAHFLLGEIGFRNLKALQEKHPKWQDDDEVSPERYRIYHDALDHFLHTHLFYGTRDELAVRGLMAAVEVYRFAGKTNRVRECLEDVRQIYPDTSLANQATEQLKAKNKNGKQITK